MRITRQVYVLIILAAIVVAPIIISGCAKGTSIDLRKALCYTQKLRFVDQESGSYYGKTGQAERGLCASDCAEYYDLEYDQECHLFFSGERGLCPIGQVCSATCKCVDGDTLLWEDNNYRNNMPDSKFHAPIEITESEGFLDADLDTFCQDICNGKLPDCDDANSNVNPDALEICDGLDNNCDGIVDNTYICGNEASCEGTACSELSIYVCKQEEEVVITEEKEGGGYQPKFIGCSQKYCNWDKGSPIESGVNGRSGQLLYCTHDVHPEEPVGEKPYYIYVCDTEAMAEGSIAAIARCEDYLVQSSFTVCQASEANLCFNGEDDDCDGLLDELDTECFTCDPDAEPSVKCNLVDRTYCAKNAEGVAEITDADYCGLNACGTIDSSCMAAVEPCLEGEKSCGQGCFPDACDIAANKVCSQGGTWTSENYCDVCGLKDNDCWSELESCEVDSCDYVAQATCYADPVPLWGYGGVDHCLRDWACGKKYDSDCAAECEPEACDTEHDKYCTSSNEWSSVDYYCDHCGYIDADCGLQQCQDGACDYVAKKVCVDGAWTEELTINVYCDTCPTGRDPYYDALAGYLCTCEPTDTNETDCANGIDEDCDGLIDCLDVEDCAPDLPECIVPPCIDGETRDCGTDVGLCEKGTETCINGEWGACEGTEGPFTEICNSFDDDCDDSVDEGCGDCTAGETRTCGSITGECGAGIQVCSEQTGLWSVCYGDGYTSSSALDVCDGLDNDCDGEIDEGCSCSPGDTQECGNSVGECLPGTQTCLDSAEWGECTGMTGPTTEICSEGLDEDCDGFIDLADSDCDPNLNNPPTPTCFDTIKNQGEEQVDCGGPCEPCNSVTCNDRKKNGDETGLDCGGSKCPPCKGEKITAPKVEVKEEAECGDGFCEDDEDEETCPEDCAPVEEEAGFPFVTVVIAIVLLGIFGLGGFMVFKNIKAGRQPLDITMLKKLFVKKGAPVKPGKPLPGKPMPKPAAPVKPTPAKPLSKPSLGKKKKILSREEEALQKSLKKSKEMFK